MHRKDVQAVSEEQVLGAITTGIDGGQEDFELIELASQASHGTSHELEVIDAMSTGDWTDLQFAADMRSQSSSEPSYVSVQSCASNPRSTVPVESQDSRELWNELIQKFDALEQMSKQDPEDHSDESSELPPPVVQPIATAKMSTKQTIALSLGLLASPCLPISLLNLVRCKSVNPPAVPALNVQPIKLDRNWRSSLSTGAACCTSFGISWCDGNGKSTSNIESTLFSISFNIKFSSVGFDSKFMRKKYAANINSINILETDFAR